MIDWQKVVLNLQNQYGPITRIGRELSIKDDHLRRLARGEVAEPRFNSGVKLLDLHFDVMGERHREVLCNA
jgi:hypothetical protein